MKVKAVGRFLLATVVVGMLWGCHKEESHLKVSPRELWGEWVQVNDTSYHWTYEDDFTGSLIHTGAIRPGDEHNGDFTWAIRNGDELEMEFKGSGELGGIDILKFVTIKSVTDSTLRWKDDYDRTMTLRRIR